MMLEHLKRVIVRDLESVISELNAYPNEGQIWELPDGVSNSAGTLALHLAGNLQHFIGAQLGGTGYVRNRPAEFSARDVPPDSIEKEIRAAIEAVTRTLDSLTESDLQADYPEEFAGRRLSTGQFLAHLSSHLAYHVGQIDYHRRVVTGNPSPAGGSDIGGLVD